MANSYSEELTIIPLKKPILDKITKEQKLTQGILKPIAKPVKNNMDKELSNKIIKPQNKPIKELKPKIVKEVEKKTTDIIVKKIERIDFLIPKSKPLVVKKTSTATKTKSKYYSQNDFNIAKKSIQAIEKRQWSSALSFSKKAKDKSIYTFIQWRHLLTTGNQASFYDYMTFINRNENYPRINRIRYLAEHKLSTDKISPKKIIDWFGVNQPLSGFGKLILGESFIKRGDIQKGTSLIKDGWITADLSRSEMKFFRKRFKKFLNVDDYIKRADYLAWENKYWDLKRMLRYLPKDYELLYTARQILMSKSYGVDNAIANVPPKLKNDAGLNYDRLKWRRKRGRVDDSLEIIFKVKNNKNYLVRPDKWWIERAIMTRALIYKKKI